MRGLSGRRCLVVVAALGLACLSPGAAHAATGFGDEVALPWLDNPYPIAVASGAPGEVIVVPQPVYSGNDAGPLLASVLVPGHDDATPQTLADPGWPAVVAANASGQAIVAWIRSENEG